MKLRALLPLLCLVIGAVSGCSVAGSDAAKRGEDQNFARSLAESAAWAAVAKPGTGVCRLMRVGIAEHDWIRGVVVEVHKPTVSVRITDPGRFTHELDGIMLPAGAIVRVAPAGWTLCR